MRFTIYWPPFKGAPILMTSNPFYDSKGLVRHNNPQERAGGTEIEEETIQGVT